MQKSGLFFGRVMALALTVTALATAQKRTIQLYAGDYTDNPNLCAVSGPNCVGQLAANTIYRLGPGTYYRWSIQPKDGDEFYGATPPDAPSILNGSVEVTGWAPNNSFWTAPGSTYGMSETTNPPCMDGTTGCQWPQDLFYDGVPKQHVASKEGLVSGTWWFDTTTGVIWVADDPNGHTVELSESVFAFSSDSATKVKIQGLVIEKYASPPDEGSGGFPTYAIRGGDGWLLQDSEIRLNHGTGVQIFGNGTVFDNNIHDNGQLGVGYWSDGATAGAIQANQVRSNNFAGYAWLDENGEAGGIKVARVSGLLIDGNIVEYNKGSRDMGGRG